MAWRYLFARKSHSAVSIIAIVSVCGVALATMATVCVLSVFNGFRGLVAERDSRITPDLLITPASEPVIANADSLAEAVASMPGVEVASPVVIDNAVAYRMHMQLPVKLLGVDPEAFRRLTGVNSMIKPGGRYLSSTDSEATPHGTEGAEESVAAAGEFDEDALFADIGVEETLDEVNAPVQQTLLSIGAASQLGVSAAVNPEELDAEGVVLFMPRRTATTLNEANPAASFMTDSLAIAGVVESEQNEFDANTMIVDLSLARSLLEYDTQASAIYVKVSQQKPMTAEELQRHLGDRYEVRDRLQQQTVHLRMISIEKWITFLLLSFILLIASFNVISTISMLIVDKRQDILTLSRLGASGRMISEIFCWESAYVCAAGTVSGALLGVVLCLLQQHFGFIGIGGDASMLIVTAYPVEVRFTDLLWVLIPAVAIAFVTAFVAARFARRGLTQD